MPRGIRFYLDYLQDWDGKLCVSVNRTSRYRLVSAWFRLVSRLGDGVFWYGLMAAILLAQHQIGVRPVAHMVLAGLVGTVVYKWLKSKTLRPRPYQVRQDIRLTGKPLDYFSFPSGHTLHAVIFSLIAVSYYPALAVILLPFTVMVAASRMVLGLHYPSDVLAGAAIGVSIATISFEVVALI